MSPIPVRQEDGHCPWGCPEALGLPAPWVPAQAGELVSLHSRPSPAPPPGRLAVPRPSLALCSSAAVGKREPGPIIPCMGICGVPASYRMGCGPGRADNPNVPFSCTVPAVHLLLPTGSLCSWSHAKDRQAQPSQTLEDLVPPLVTWTLCRSLSAMALPSDHRICVCTPSCPGLCPGSWSPHLAACSPACMPTAGAGLVPGCLFYDDSRGSPGHSSPRRSEVQCVAGGSQHRAEPSSLGGQPPRGDARCCAGKGPGGDTLCVSDPPCILHPRPYNRDPPELYPVGKRLKTGVCMCVRLKTSVHMHVCVSETRGLEGRYLVGPHSSNAFLLHEK